MGFTRARRLQDFILKNIGKVGERKFFIACNKLTPYFLENEKRTGKVEQNYLQR